MKKESINWGQIGTIAAGSFLAITIGAFADEIIDYLKSKHLQSKSKDYYEKMIKAHPELKKEDPKLVARYWASLFHFAPNMAADPLAAGAFLRQSIERGSPEVFGGPTIDSIGTLTNINKSVSENKSKKSPFTDATVNAAGSLLGKGLQDSAGLN